jgi:putative transposase
VAVTGIVPVPDDSFEQTLAAAGSDLLREMIRGFAQRMMDAEVETLCGAGYGEVSAQWVNSRNGCRPREWDTRAGTVELAVPKLRHGSYFPSFLPSGGQIRAPLTHRKLRRTARITETSQPASMSRPAI